MQVRFLFLLSLCLTAGCGGGDKHLPSSNPPEYDPKKVYTTPAAPPSAPATVAKATELERLRSKLDSLEMGAKGKGEGKKVPFDPNSLQLFKGVRSPCEALSRLAPGLGSDQLFTGVQGAALKKALGQDAGGIARRMDEQLAEGLKHSLGPGAADCPISVRPRKSSGFIDRSQPPRLVLAHTTPTQPLLLAQTTITDTSQDDFEVRKSSSRENPPPDWVGYKSRETMTRIGKKPHTEGFRELYEMIIAPKAKQCPHLEGPELKGMVDGTFEWSFEMYRATTGPDGEPHGVLYRRHVVAELKGKVGDDAKVQYVDFDVTVTLQHIGTELPHYSHSASIRGQFTIDQRMMGIPEGFKVIEVSDFSAGEAEAKDAQLIGNLTALMAYFSGLAYFEAQTEWKDKPNTCVQIIFTPATKTKKLGPNESVAVKMELRTKEGSTVVPAKFKEAKERPRERNGNVSPREAESQPGAPATFTYRAPATRVRHSGFWVGAVSRAGVAQALDGEWEAADSGLRLRIEHRIQHDPQSGYAKGGHAQFDGTVQFEIPLEQLGEGWFRGEIDVNRPMVVRHVRPAANPCSGSGSQTEHWRVSTRVDPTGEFMNMHVGFTSSNEQASWTCSGPAGTFTDELYIDIHGILKSVQLPIMSGTMREFTDRDPKLLEWLRVTVVEGSE
jgi:hypothetical protein